jgi:Tol biopolymer transport system component
MGEVWRARDTRLGRDVAIKIILPGLFAADPDRLSRFRREAQLLASLNHPHIAAIYGLEETDGLEALVLELVEGPTLADRIAQGPLPVDEALAIARQIADALEAAHDHGIIHRDLKPANIKLRPDGAVKVLDFGLAKALEPAGPSTQPTESPTLTAHGTQLGVILGTAAYMAPEQAKGKPMDERADVWAFGAVLYEMLTGRRAFAGEDVTDTIAFVITREPDWSAIPEATPAAIKRLLRRSLEKDRRKRLADIRDARLELDDTTPEPAGSGVRQPTSRRERSMWASLVFVLALTAVGFAIRFWQPAPTPQELRLDIITPPPLESSIALSPDGRKLAFVAAHENRWLLWIRELDTGRNRPLIGTDNGRLPFWSSDSASIGFFTGEQMKRVDIAGGAPQSLAPVATAGGGTWHGDIILFSPNSTIGQIRRMPASGGESVPITKPTPPEIGHRHPVFLPDGRHFLYAANVASATSRIYVSDLEGSTPPTRLPDAEGSPVYDGAGHLLLVRNGTLYAHDFDLESLTVRGTPVAIAEDVTVSGALVRSAVSASATGAIAFRTGPEAGRRRLIWFDRSGKELGKLPYGDFNGLANPIMTPDERRLAMQGTANGNVDIWTLDLTRGVYNRFTSDSSPDALPVWSPDGRQIAFNSPRLGTADFYIKPADDSGPEKLLVSLPTNERATDWSRDGKTLLFKTADPNVGLSDVWALPLAEPQKAFRVLGSPADERDAQFSPDARWIAYQSDESGRPEIYVQRFPEPGGKAIVSNAGGTQVRWSRNGTEIFYINPENALMVVPVRIPPGNGPLTIGAPTRLFSARIVPSSQAIARQQYVVSNDGKRFLMNIIEEAPTAQTTLLLNWRRR